MRKTRIALASIASQFGRPEANLATMLDMIGRAARSGADLVCFPEVGLQGYHTDVHLMRSQAETLDGPSCTRLRAAARTHRLVVSVGMALRVERRVLNAQAFLGADGPLGFAAKMHLCEPEAQLFDPGDRWPVIDLGFARIGTVICFDAEFPEAARCLALDGADILLMSFATGRCDSCGRPQDPRAWPAQVGAWAPARAYENRVFVAAVNAAGDVHDADGVCATSWAPAGAVHRWPGYAFALDPSGALLAESSRAHNGQNLLLADLDPAALAQWRTGGGDFLLYRRPDTYGRIVDQAGPGRGGNRRGRDGRSGCGVTAIGDA